MFKETILRYTSISHRTAPLARRERFHITDKERTELTATLRETYTDVRSLLLLVTCNRTEFYFESGRTTAAEIRDFFLEWKIGKIAADDQADFRLSDQTEATVAHLLKVSTGLESAVLGDAEIIHQIKKAYHYSLEQQLQGSLLERCMQSLFRCHKRVTNETEFRDGTTSTAYKALKTIGHTYGPAASEKRILIVGAGDIVRQVFKYNTKFGYKNIWVANRTASKAEYLSRVHKVQTYPWEKVQCNDLSGFDVIISAVSHSPSIIRTGIADRPVLLVDLAVPANIAPDLGRQENVVLEDMDSIARQLQHNRDNRSAAAVNVERLVEEELAGYLQWYRMQPFRNLMAGRKAKVIDLLSDGSLQGRNGTSYQDLKQATDRIMRRVLKSPEALHSNAALDQIVAEFLQMQPV